MSPQWLLRSSRDGHFHLMGPMDRDEVIRSIRDGKVSINDEACPANGYWFSFHESEELHRHMGISWSQLMRVAGDTDVTGEESTRQSVDEGETDEITVSGSHSSPGAASPVQTTQDPSFDEESGGVAPGLFGVPVWGWWVISLVLFAAVMRFL